MVSIDSVKPNVHVPVISMYSTLHSKLIPNLPNFHSRFSASFPVSLDTPGSLQSCSSNHFQSPLLITTVTFQHLTAASIVQTSELQQYLWTPTLTVPFPFLYLVTV